MLTTDLKRTPLYDSYADYPGARCIDFGGWELPVQFSGILSEHDAVRQRAGLFDVSHMGEIIVAGPDAESFLQRMTTNDVTRLADGAAQYTLLCYPDGGVVDDLLVYRIRRDKYMLVVNASNTDKVDLWLREHAAGDLSIRNVSSDIALLAIQGPLAYEIMSEVSDAATLRSLKPFHFAVDVPVAGFPALVSRSGYTGEDGFELYLSFEHAPRVWQALLDAGTPHGLVPAGLGARDTLRLEARLPLYGQELSATISPLEAGLRPFVKLDKGEFIGADALRLQAANGPARRLVGLEMIERSIPRSHYPVYDGERIIGEVTSGTQSPTTKRNIGLALIESAYAELGTEVLVDIRGHKRKAVVVSTPFYKRAKETNS